MQATAINLVNQQEMLQPDGSSIILIHFAHRDEDNKRWKIACVPNLEEKDMSASDKCPHPWKRSDDPRAVTCSICKESVAYKSTNALLCASSGRR